MRTINDWRLDEDLLAGHPGLVVGFFSRLDPEHWNFLDKITDLERRFGDDADFAVVDLAEHPSLVCELHATVLPLLIAWSHGQEVGRWSGRMDMRVVAPKLAAAIR